MTPHCLSGIALEFSLHSTGIWSLAADPAVTNSAANLFSMAMERELAWSASADSMLNRCLWPRELGQRPHDDGVCSSQMPQRLCSRSWGQRQDVSQLSLCYRTEARTCFWNGYIKQDKMDEKGWGFLCLFPSAGVSLELVRSITTFFSLTGYKMKFYWEKVLIFSGWMQTNGNNEDTNSPTNLKCSFYSF